MKDKGDALYGIKVTVYPGEQGTRISPSIADITDIETQLEALHQSILLVEAYMKRKEAKKKTIIVRGANTRSQ